MIQQAQKSHFKEINFIGYASGWGAQIRGTEFGPQTLFESDCFDAFKDAITSHTAHHISYGILNPSLSSKDQDIPPGVLTLPIIHPLLEDLGHAVEKTLGRGHFPFVIGGDHTMAIGTFAGATKALNLQENFGLIWIDAHLDSHTPATSPSNAYHGMPAATLLGHGDQNLVDLLTKGAKIKPEHLVFIGIRSYEPEEKALLEKLGVRIYFMDDVTEQGFDQILKEAIDHVTKNTDGFGVSLDLDVFDPKFVPGVGSPEENGLDPKATLKGLKALSVHPAFKVCEITEFNPLRDQNQKTLQVIGDLLEVMVPAETVVTPNQLPLEKEIS